MAKRGTKRRGPSGPFVTEEGHVELPTGELFVVTATLSTGAFFTNATVYRAADARGVAVAIKVGLNDRHGAAEAHALAALRYLGEGRVQHLCRPLYAVGPHYLAVTTWVPRGGLSPRSYADPARLTVLVADMTRALATVHRLGLVHCDVKPQNIFGTWASDRPFVLGDFNMSKEAGATVDFRHHPPLGTLDFMAPEVTRATADLGRVTVSVALDIYSLGATVSRLLGARLKCPPLRVFINRACAALPADRRMEPVAP